MLFNKWASAMISCAVLSLSACGGQNQSNHDTANAQASNAQTNTDKVYRVAMNAEFAPFEFLTEKQEVKGFDVDLMNALAKAGNFKVEFQHKPWDTLFPSLNNGDVDILISAITITEERQQTMDFTDPYYQIKQIVLVPAGKNVTSVNDLKKLSRIGVVNGQTGDLAAQKIFGNTSSAIARFETVPLMLKEIENGGLDAAISDSAVIANYVKNNSDKGFSMVEVPDFTVENYGIAVRKGDTDTLNMLNNALKSVHENGDYEHISNQYFEK